MKIPAPKPKAPTPAAAQLPPAYALMAAAHMQQNLGKPVFAQPGVQQGTGDAQSE